MKIKSFFQKNITILLMALCLGSISGCNDDNEFITNDIGSSLEIKNSYRVSKFTLNEDFWTLPDTLKSISITLRSLSDDSSYDYFAKIVSKKDLKEINMIIPKNHKIKDSDYLMTGIKENGYSVGQTLTVTFKNEMLQEVLKAETNYGKHLKGEGTAASPYLISSLEHFRYFQMDLEGDMNKAAGKIFKQTIDIKYTGSISGGDDNFLYFGHGFAGHYDGGGHTVNFNHVGPVYQQGFFSKLYNGACIENLNIEAVMSGVSSNIGMLAGSAEGNIHVKNVTLRGSISYVPGTSSTMDSLQINNGDNIGGLIGCATDADITIQKCQMTGTISGYDNVGGLIGLLKNSTLSTDSVYIPKDHGFAVKGHDKVGFVCGSADTARIALNNVICYLPKQVSVHGKGKDVGGLIGYFFASEHSSIKNSRFYSDIYGQGNMGGFIGHVELNGKSLTVEKCNIDTVVFHREQPNIDGYHIGGFVGNAHAIGNGYLSMKSTNVNNCTLEGKKYVGGLFGTLKGKLEVNSKCEINAKVTASEFSAGGVAGSTDNTTLNLGDKAIILKNTCVIKGGNAIGGIVGLAENSSIEGSLPALKFPTIMKPEKYTSTFGGVVEGIGEEKSIGGLIGACRGTKLRNLCFSGKVSGKAEIGGIVGYMGTANMQNCVNRATCISGTFKVGGIIGRFQSENSKDITFHHVINFTEIPESSEAGGIIGMVELSSREVKKEKMLFDYMVNVGNVTGKSHVGGCFGYLQDDKNRSNEDAESGGNHFIRYSANYGKITSKEGAYAGGILGQTDSRTVLIQFSANHGEVYGKDKQKASVGGIVGEFGHEPDGSAAIYETSNGEIRECCNFGKIHAEGDKSNVGGLVGLKEEGHGNQHGEWWQIKDSYNAGTVARHGNSQDLAGICGYLDRHNVIKHCINMGSVDDGKGNAMVGDSKGSSKVVECYILSGSSQNDEGTSLSAENFKISSSFEGFEFDKKWILVEDAEHPTLKECPFQNVQPE